MRGGQPGCLAGVEGEVGRAQLAERTRHLEKGEARERLVPPSDHNAHPRRQGLECTCQSLPCVHREQVRIVNEHETCARRFEHLCIILEQATDLRGSLLVVVHRHPAHQLPARFEPTSPTRNQGRLAAAGRTPHTGDRVGSVKQGGESRIEPWPLDVPSWHRWNEPTVSAPILSPCVCQSTHDSPPECCSLRGLSGQYSGC